MDAPDGPRPIVLDVDTGVDDALALALAVKSPHVELVATTTLAGNVNLERTTINTLTVLDWLGANDVPVHRGASRPLVRPLIDAGHVHGDNGLGNATLPESARQVAADRGPAAIVRLANERPGELTLVCTGPLTNLAIALNVEPRLPELLDRLMIMGGAFYVPGNVTPHAEFNIYCDPEAAQFVFAADWPNATATGLDVTEQVALTRADWEAAGTRQSAVAKLIAAVCRHSFQERGVKEFFLHDPLALAVAIDQRLVGTEPSAISVDLDGDTRGTTRVTGEGTWQVARTVERNRFLALARAAWDLAEENPAG